MDAGLLSTTIDPLGHTTQYLYDSHRHLTATVDLAGLTTHYGYSATNQTMQLALPTCPIRRTKAAPKQTLLFISTCRSTPQELECSFEYYQYLDS